MKAKEQDLINTIINTLRETTEANEDLTIEIQKDIIKKLEILVNNPRVEEKYIGKLLDLKDLVRNHRQSLFCKGDFNGILTDIIKAYTFDKYHSSIDLYSLNIKLKEEMYLFLEALRAFFYVKAVITKQTKRFFEIEIYITRFKGVNRWVSKNRFEDSINCVIYGSFYGFSARQVFNYIKEMEYFHLIK